MQLSGILAILLLGSGLAILAGVALFNPHGGHAVAGWVWLAFLMIALGLLLGVLHLILRAIAVARRSGR